MKSNIRDCTITIENYKFPLNILINICTQDELSYDCFIYSTELALNLEARSLAKKSKYGTYQGTCKLMRIIQKEINECSIV